MTHWKLTAFLYRGRDLSQTLWTTRAERQWKEIISEHPKHDGDFLQETLQTSRSNHGPCGTDIHLGLQQSRKKKLVSFASLLATSGTFNPLSKVLFIFPSRYLFAIGLEPIFSVRRKLPPILRTTSKVRDSTKPLRMLKPVHVNGILTLYDAFFQKDLRSRSNWKRI
jgi:hypothetical protein